MTTPFGNFRPTRLAFGWKNFPGYFANVVTDVMRGIPNVIVYCDDIIIHTKTRAEHARTIKMVFRKLRERGLSLSAKKCYFLKSSIDILGHEVSAQGVRMQPSKMEAIRKLGTPKSTKQLMTALGLINYYRAFLPNLAKVARPLYQLTKAKLIDKRPNVSGHVKKKRIYVPFVWGEEQEQAWKECKALVAQNVMLKFPEKDWPWVLDTDASSFALGVVLLRSTPMDESTLWNVSAGHWLQTRQIGMCVNRKCCNCRGYQKISTLFAGQAIYRTH
jgi:hypothetical protein